LSLETVFIFVHVTENFQEDEMWWNFLSSFQSMSHSFHFNCALWLLSVLAWKAPYHVLLCL